MWFDPYSYFYDDDSSDDYYGGGYSSDDYESPRRIVQLGSTLNKDGRVHSVDHADIFRKHLHDLFLSSDYCDVTLETSTATFKAHKVVLAANSDYFYAMFSSTCSESLNSVVSFKENPSVTSTGLSAILDYAYSGSFSITQSSVRDILEVARHLLMRDVTKSCEKFIEGITIKLDNYVELFETTSEFGLTGVVKRIERFLENNEVNMDNYFEMIDFFAMASNSDAVLKKVITFISSELHSLMFLKELLDIMDPNTLMAMVKSDRHGLSTDMTLINFIVKWVETSSEDRLPVLSDVIKEINLLSFEVETLDEIANLPFFKADGKVIEQISEAKSHLLEDKEYCTEDDLYVFTASRFDVKFYCIAAESDITRKGVLDIPGRKRTHVSMYDSSVIAVGDILFLVGMPTYRDNGKRECACFSYNPGRNLWKELASLLSDRKGYRLVSSEDEVYAICGLESYNPTSTFDVYDFTRDEWRTETPLPHQYQSLTAASLSGSIYVYGYIYERSSHGSGGSNAFLIYDRERKRWAVKRRPMICYNRYGIFQIGHLVACTNGLYQITQDSATQHLYDDDVPALGVQCYDQTSNHWQYSTLYHTFDDFCIKAVLSHMDDMYILAKYTKKSDASRYGRTVNSIFRFNKASWKIELLKENFTCDYDKIALVNIPKASIARFAE